MVTINNHQNHDTNNNASKTTGNDKKIAMNQIKSSAGNSVIEAMKRKFQRVNQEIVKQNVLLQENLARIRQDQHTTLQENVRLKGRLVALESKLKEAESVVSETKKSIADRIEILEAIAEHLIQVTKFLRVLSEDEEQREASLVNEVNEIFDENFKKDPKVIKSSRKPHGSNPMQPIAEEDVLELTDHIGDVSLDHQKPSKRSNSKRNK